MDVGVDVPLWIEPSEGRETANEAALSSVGNENENH